MANLVMQELNNDPLLQHVMRDVDGQRRPVLGGIPLLSKIGEGVTGAVYRAVHPTLNRDVVVKVMLFPDEKSLRFQRFMAHAQSARNVKSKHLVEVLDAATEAGLVYIVSEYVEGISGEKHLQNLKERLKPGLPETALLNLAIATVDALVAAHNENVVHLDIRPSCILIPKAANGDLAFADAKLGDLGQAYNEFIGRFLIGTSAETGMPGYMSPEQAMGVENPGKTSDVFSMGASMYALLVGQSPFGGLTIDNVLSATLHQPIGDVRTWRPDVSRATSKIVEICLRKHPAARFADARILLQALQISLDSLDCGIDIQQAAVEEIEALVKSVSSAELPAANIMPVSAALSDQLAQAAASHVTLPVLPPTTPQPALSAPVNAVAPVTDQAAEPTIITAMPTQVPKKATELFSDLLKPKPPGQLSAFPASSQRTQAISASTGTVPTAGPGTRIIPAPGTKTVPVQPPPAEWVDPTVEAEAAEEPPKRKSSAGVLVAALLLVGLGGAAWKLGYIPIGQKKTVVAQKKLPPAVITPPSTNGVVEPKTAEPDKTAAELSAAKEKEAQAKLESEAKLAKVKEEQARLAKETADKLAKEKEEQARLAKENEAKIAKQKADEEAAKTAALKAKAEEERLAAERLAKQKEEDAARLAIEQKRNDEELRAQEAARLAKLKHEEDAKLAAVQKAKEEQARLAREAEARQKQEEAKRLAEQKAKADKERLELEAANLAKQKEEEAARAAALKAKAEKERLANEASAKIAAAKLPKEIEIKLGEGVAIDFVLVESGSFLMGTDRAKLSEMARNAGANENDFLDEVPAHTAELVSYYIAKAPVTVRQFRRFVEATGYKTSAEKAGAAYVLNNREWKFTPGANWAKPGFSQKDDHPAVLLSWRDCEAFTKWVSHETGRAIRLPSEAEWEYAARGPSSLTYPWGNVWDGRLANHADKRLQQHAPSDWITSKFDDGFSFTSPVDKFVNASWCGALDMAGNVWEWCADVYEPYPQNNSAPRIIEDSSDVPPDAKRVLRGGSWLLRGFECRAAARRGSSPRAASCEFGMRLAFTPAASK